MLARALSVVSLGAALLGCASAPEPIHMEDWVRMGVSVQQEAGEVRATLEAAGWTTTRTVGRPTFVALALSRGADERAVRVITSRGVVVALDSHESDGYRVRHGLVELGDEGPQDVDGDGREELLVWRRDGAFPCLAVLRFDEQGGATVMADDAAALREGACVTRLEDVDADGRVEAIAVLRWPGLALAEQTPGLEVPLVEQDGAWRAGHVPVAYEESQREIRRVMLEAARARRDVDTAVRLAVEVAALAHLTGASRSAQVERFDAALSGLVLDDEQRNRIAEIRAVVSSGWRESDG